MAAVSLTDYGSQQAEIQRRQKLAQMLSEQGQQDIPIQSYNGIQAAIPWTAVLAKALNSGLGAYQEKKAAEASDKLQSKQRDEASQFIQGLGSISGQAMPVQSISQTPDVQLAQGQPQLPTGPMTAGPAPTGPSPSAQDYAKALGPPAPAPQPMPTPPPQPGYADTAPMTFTPQQQAAETQQRLLQASMSGNPLLEKVAPTLYAHNQAMADKADERQFQMSMAEAKAQASLQSKLLFEQMKPEQKTAMQKDYVMAKGQGYSGSFMDFMQFAAPKFISTQADQQLFNQRTLAGGPPTGQPIAGPQLEALITQGFPGAAITSRARTPEQNDMANGVPNSAHLTNNARDFTLPSQQAMQQAADAINQQGLPGVRAIYEGPGAKNSTGPHVHVEVVPQGLQGGPPQPVAIGPPHPQRAGATSGQWMLTDEEQAAINKAVGERRIDLKGLNSRTAKIAAQALIANPGMNAIQLHAIGNVTANPAFQQRAKALEALPSSLELVKKAGEKLDFSNLKIVAGGQAIWLDQTNNADFRNYMGKRNDALQRLAYAMRGVGMSDKAVELELQAAPVAMGPRGFEGWYSGQMEMVQNQIAQQAVFQVVGPGGGGGPPAPAAPMSDAQRLAKYGIH